MRTNPKFRKWCRWLETITEDVWTLYLYRDIFSNVMGIVKKNERIDKGSMFFGFFENIYVDSVVMGIRRQLKASGDSISLYGLLDDIAAHPELVTRSDFYELYEGDPITHPEMKAVMMREEFDRFADPNSPHIDSKRVKDDLQLLKDICNAAEEYADRRIAHLDKRGPSLGLTLEGIFEALNSLGKLIQRYQLLFFARDLQLHPYPQRPIYHVFTEPWLASETPENKCAEKAEQQTQQHEIGL